MADAVRKPSVDDSQLNQFEHPRGALAVVLIFGVLFALGWAVFYFWLFLGRGGTHA